MLSATFLQTIFLVVGAGLSLAKPIYPRFTVGQGHFEVLALRNSMEVNPNAVTNVECIDPNLHIVFHDQNIAELAICGGSLASGAATARCEGPNARTTGQSHSARFTLQAADDGAAIDVAKARWEQCVRAARAVCPTGSLRATCVGAAARGRSDVHFVLDSPDSGPAEL